MALTGKDRDLYRGNLADMEAGGLSDVKFTVVADPDSSGDDLERVYANILRQRAKLTVEP